MARLLHILATNIKYYREEIMVNDPDLETRPMSWFCKALCLAVVGCFVLVGLVGLILPIIPGILFLILAAFLLAKISTRFNFLFKSSSFLGRWMKFRRSTAALTIVQRVKLSFWVLARSVVGGVEAGVRFIRKT